MEALERMPFTAQKKIFKRLAEIADSSSLSQEEREKYEESRKVADDWYPGMYGSWISGNKAGLEEGLAKGIDQTNKKNSTKDAIGWSARFSHQRVYRIILGANQSPKELNLGPKHEQ